MPLRLSGFQMAVTEDISRNTAVLCRAIQEASAAHADILLTPEGSLSGYTPHFDASAVRAALEEVSRLARQLKVGLALGTCFKEVDGLVYNQVRFYTPEGSAGSLPRYLGFHSKILRCGTMEANPQGEIKDYATTELKVFPFGETTIGGLICNDLWANPACTPMPDPHLTQQLARMGATIVFHAVNGGRDGSTWSRQVCWNFHEANLRMRAAAGGLWIVTVDNCYPTELPCSAPSGVINPQGEWVCRTPPQGEQFFCYP